MTAMTAMTVGTDSIGTARNAEESSSTAMLARAPMPPALQRRCLTVQGGRRYLPAADALIWFRSEHPSGGVVTEMLSHDAEARSATFKACVFDGDGRLLGVGHASDQWTGNIQKYLENAETGAINRALKHAGYSAAAGEYGGDYAEYEGREDGRGYDGNGRSGGSPAVSAPQPGGATYCADCDVALRPAQVTTSVQHYGRPLCPGHQTAEQERRSKGL